MPTRGEHPLDVFFSGLQVLSSVLAVADTSTPVVSRCSRKICIANLCMQGVAGSGICTERQRKKSAIALNHSNSGRETAAGWIGYARQPTS